MIEVFSISQEEDTKDVWVWLLSFTDQLLSAVIVIVYIAYYNVPSTWFSFTFLRILVKHQSGSCPGSWSIDEPLEKVKIMDLQIHDEESTPYL